MDEARYVVRPPSEGGGSAFVVEDTRGRKRIASIWWGGPADVPAHRIAVRLARWLNELAAIDAENRRQQEEEKGR